MASLVSCDRAGSLVGYEGGKLITKFDPWMLLLFLRCLSEMCELDESSGFDPFRRLRMCKTHMLLKAFKLLPLDDRKTKKQRCEFACPEESIGVTSCCGRRECSYHKRQQCCSCKKARTVVEVTPRVIVKLCSLARGPRWQDCATCKYSACPRHQTPCKNEAFSACHFCQRFNCERGDCAKTICCLGVVNHLKKFGKQPSPVKNLPAVLCTKEAIAVATPGTSLSNCSADLARGNVPLLLAKKAPAAVIALCTDAAVLCSKDAITVATPGTSLSNCSADLARGNVPLFTLRADTAAAPILPARNAPAAIALCTTDAAAACCVNLTCASQELGAMEMRSK